MKKIILSLLTSVICSMSFAQHLMNSDGIAEFKSVNIQGKITLDITAAETASISAEVSDASDTSKFSWYVKDECLYIKLNRGIRNTPSATVRLTVPYLEKIVAVDATVTLNQFNTTIFDLETSSDASVVLNLTCSDIAIKASGTSQVKLFGSSKYMTLSASASSMVNATDFNVRSANVSTTMMAEAIVNVGERLVAQANVDSMIRYLGDPTIARVKTSVKGEVLKVD